MIARKRFLATMLAACCCALPLLGSETASGATTFTLSGTISEAGCTSSSACPPLPSTEQLAVSFDTSSRVATVEPDSSGNYSVVLPAGNYQVTPGVLGVGASRITGFTPQSLNVDLRGDVSGVNFSYTLAPAAAPAVGRLNLGGSLSDIELQTFNVSGASPLRSGSKAARKTIAMSTRETHLATKIFARVRSGQRVPRATLTIYKRGTHTPAFTLAFTGAVVAEATRTGDGSELKLSVRAERSGSPAR